MTKYKISVSIDEKNFFWIIVANGTIINKVPTKEDLDKIKTRNYNKTNICHKCREENNITYKSILFPKNACQEKDENGNGTGKWICTKHWLRNQSDHNISGIDEDCIQYFGIEIAEKCVFSIFEDAKRMPMHNPGFDWICNKGYRVQHKAACLTNNNGSFRYKYNIEYNDNTDYYILTAWKDRKSLEPTRIWLIHKNEIINGKPFWMRNYFSITNKPQFLSEYDTYKLDKLDKLKDHALKMISENNCRAYY